MEMKSAKIKYKQAIKICKHDYNVYIYLSNDLHDLLVSKDVTGFGKMWNAKLCVSKTSPAIDGITESVVILRRGLPILL